MSVVEKLAIEAAETTVGAAQPESDQPDDAAAVSLEDVLGADEPEQNQGEEATGAEDQAGDANPQPPVPKEKLLTQAEFDKAFGQRANGLRQQFEREHQDELALAALLKQAYAGKSRQEIEDVILREQARKVAEETGWDDEEALNRVRARMNFDRHGTTDAPDEHLALLEKQLEKVQKREGIDMLPVIQADEYLSGQVDSGQMDIEDAFAYYLRNQMGLSSGRGGASPAKPKAAPVISQASGVYTGAARSLSDAEFHRIDAMLKKGYKVRA